MLISVFQLSLLPRASSKHSQTQVSPAGRPALHSNKTKRRPPSPRKPRTQAIEWCSSLKVPIYVTETGISDAVDDRRAAFMDEYMGQVGTTSDTYNHTLFPASLKPCDNVGLTYISHSQFCNFAHGSNIHSTPSPQTSQLIPTPNYLLDNNAEQ